MRKTGATVCILNICFKISVFFLPNFPITVQLNIVRIVKNQRLSLIFEKGKVEDKKNKNHNLSSVFLHVNNLRKSITNKIFKTIAIIFYIIVQHN